MINAVLFCLIVCFTVSCWAAQATTSHPQAGCTFGPTIGQELNQIGNVGGGNMKIRCNHTCSQVICSGRLDTRIIRGFSLPFCFSLSLNHCDSPVSFGYNVQIPDRNISLKGKVDHDTSQEIPGPSTNLGSVSFIISTTVEHVNDTVEFGINVSVKISSNGLDWFPEQFALLPVQSVAVTPCSHGASSPTPIPLSQQCSTAPPVTSPTVTPKIIPKSKTYGKTCEVGIINGQCGLYEMCVYNGKLRKDGTCHCKSDATLSPVTGLCTPDFKTTSPKSTLTPSVGTKSVTQSTSGNKKSGSKNMVVIACSVVGGVILIAVVVGTIVCIRRRRRNSVYRDRLQLLTDDDDDDDTNAVI